MNIPDTADENVTADKNVNESKSQTAKYKIGQVVRHKIFPFRGIIFDVDPEFSNSEEWWLSIPEDIRPKKEQPFYHLLAENDETDYVAYVSEQNLTPDFSGEPISHPQIEDIFTDFSIEDCTYTLRNNSFH